MSKINPKVASELVVHIEGSSQTEKAAKLGVSQSNLSKKLKRDNYETDWLQLLIDKSGRAVVLLPGGDYRVLSTEDLKRLGII